jgi:hypothetical protein
MTTTTLIAASPPAPPLDLDARLALRLVDMTARLNEAAVAFEVNTAHIAGADPVPETTETVPLTPTLAPAACPYNTPIAATLWRARVRIETDGWSTEAAVDEQGARCPIGAIRVEAADRHTADDACILLLDVIQAAFPTAETIPSWNAEQTSPAPVLLQLGRAAELAHTRGI